MKKLTAVISLFLLLSFSGIGLRVPLVHATALGLADGAYTIFLDFPGTANDGNASITIGPVNVISFHFANPLGEWDCGMVFQCLATNSDPDAVISNPFNGGRILIQDTAVPKATGNYLDIITNGRSVGIQIGEDASNTIVGTWTVAGVPEPNSLALMGIGVVALYLRRRRQS